MGIDERDDRGQTPRDNVDIGDDTPARQVNRPDKTNNPNGQRDRAGSDDSRGEREPDPRRQEQDPSRG